MKREKTGLTLVELLVVLAIIALLVGVLIPAVTAVKNMAKETKQKAQLTAMEMALLAFKNDHGDYPRSTIGAGASYCGAQTLAEGLLGWDLLGFHPGSVWRADGLDAADGPGTYDPLKTRDVDNDGIPDTLTERKGPYLELGTTSAFRLGDLFSPNPVGTLQPVPFVICDVFGTKKIMLADGKAVRAGSPILYYKANTSKKIISFSAPSDSIYNVYDNHYLVNLGRIADGRLHPLSQHNVFYGDPGQTPPEIGYIQDPKVPMPWPYRAHSYILISAGSDGLYGTSDDIRNFGN